MDKVTVELASQDFAQVDIIGPESDSIWQRLGMEIVKPGLKPEFQFLQFAYLGIKP